MFNVSKRLKFFLFADDTNIYYESDNLNKLVKIVNTELRSVKKWLDANKLSLNVRKTNFMIFHSINNRIDENPIIKIGKKTIQRAKFVKFLRLLLDENLSWKFHLKELSKKLPRTCGVISKIKILLPPEVFFAYIIHCSCLLPSMVLLCGIILLHLIQTQSTNFRRN